jgi:predicted AlkP superfamily phosphohydrolase/phosphomutase
MSREVLLIGLDGATFDVLDPLMNAGAMPVLRDLVASGARATLRSTVPALTPPAWTSLVTGRGPGAHGIFDFFRKDAESSPLFRLLTSQDVASPMAWSLVDHAGLRSTVLNFPLTFPAPRIAGHIVPGGFMPWRQLRLGCHPEGLFDRLQTLPSFNAHELALDMTHEAKAIEGCADDEIEPWVQMHIRRERQWVDIATYLRQNEPSAFTALLFDGTDKIQHLCWRFVDPGLSPTLASPWEHRVRETVREYYCRLDALIGELRDAFADATIVVASDHGFGPQVRTFYVNSWLAQLGLLAWHEGQAPASGDAAKLGLNQLLRHVYQLDWSRTRAFAPMPSGNGIHIVRADEAHPHGVRDDEYHAFRDMLASRLLELRDGETGEAIVARVSTREALFEGPFVHLAPDLTVELHDGGLFSILSSETVVRRRAVPTGTHRADGIFVAAGPGIERGARLEPLSILDVAPLMLHQMGLAIPTAIEGRLPTAAFEDGALAARPPRFDTSAPPVAPSAPVLDDAALDPEAEAEILARLQALGYVE